MDTGPGPDQVDLRANADVFVGIGRMAPSLQNAQPWAFRVGRDHVDLLLDRDRQLPVADPAGRQAHLGLGPAVFLLRLGLSTMDYGVQVRPWPDPAEPDLIARVSVTGRCPVIDEDRRLLAGLPARRTVRTPFTDLAVPVPLRVAWREDAEREGAGLRWIEGPGERTGVAAMVAAAERLQQRDPAYLAELDRWTAPERIAEGAGVPPSAFGITAAAGHQAEFPLRDFAGGLPTGRARHVGPAEEHPVVAVLHTPTDRREDWLRAGQAAADPPTRAALRRAAAPGAAAGGGRPAPASPFRRADELTTGTEPAADAFGRISAGGPAWRTAATTGSAGRGRSALSVVRPRRDAEEAPAGPADPEDGGEGDDRRQLPVVRAAFHQPERAGLSTANEHEHLHVHPPTERPLTWAHRVGKTVRRASP